MLNIYAKKYYRHFNLRLCFCFLFLFFCFFVFVFLFFCFCFFVFVFLFLLFSFCFCFVCTLNYKKESKDFELTRILQEESIRWKSEAVKWTISEKPNQVTYEVSKKKSYVKITRGIFTHHSFPRIRHDDEAIFDYFKFVLFRIFI